LCCGLLIESIYLQEIAMETALRQRQHVLVDGSLSNGEWFSTVSHSSLQGDGAFAFG
jgi:hypothetical protein